VNHKTNFGHLPETQSDEKQVEAAAAEQADVFRVAYDRDPAPATRRERLTRIVARYLPTEPRWDRVPWTVSIADEASLHSTGKSSGESAFDREGETVDDDEEFETPSRDSNKSEIKGSDDTTDEQESEGGLSKRSTRGVENGKSVPADEYELDRDSSSDESGGSDEDDETGARPLYDTDSEKLGQIRMAAGAYQSIESIARENALSRLQSQAFVRRQEMNRIQYAEEASRQPNSQTSPDIGWKDRGWWWMRWLRASVARGTLLYGESPWRIITTAILIILFAALAYPLGGFRRAPGPDRLTPDPIYGFSAGPIWTVDGVIGYLSVLPDSLYFSTLTFTTLGFGDFQPYGWGRMLATVETAAGAVIIALLVFVLGRRATR